MGNPYKLYQAVKSGQVKLDDLNELGRSALKHYMDEKEKAKPKSPASEHLMFNSSSLSNKVTPKWDMPKTNEIKSQTAKADNTGTLQYQKVQEVGRQSKNPVTRLFYKISDALYDKLAPKDEKGRAEFDNSIKLANEAMYGKPKPISRGQAVMSGITTGMTGGLLGFSPEEYKQIDPSHSKAHTVGRMAGYVLPSAASYKGASKVAGGLGKVAPVLSKKLPQIAIKGALTEVPLGITEGISQGKDAKGIAKNTALYAGLGALGDVAIEGILAPLIAPYAKKAGVALNKYIGDALQKTKASTTLSAIVDEDALAKEFARNLGVDWDSMNTTQRSAIRKLALNAQAPATQSGKLLKSAPGEGSGFIMVDPKAKAQEALKLTPKEEIVAKSLVKNNLDVGSVKNQVKKQRDEILNEYVDYLKASGGQGVEQGGLIRDDTGTVIGRYGRTSRNPEWYRDFYRDYGRKPTNREYVEIAISHLTEGVPSEGIPANSEFISLDNTLKGLQGMEGKPLPIKFKQTLELPKLKDKTPIPKTPEGFNIDPNLGRRALNGGPLDPPISRLDTPATKPLTKTDLPRTIKNDDDALLASGKWKDKPKLLLKRETMERNFEDVMGKDAPEMIKTYLDPVHKGESNRTRWLNKERSEIASLGIKPRSKDSSLLQQFGEGKINLQELKGQTSNWEKVVEATKFIRDKYDSYLKQINEVLVRNGYDPIPKRKDYFMHFQELSERFEVFGIPKSKKDWATFLKTDALPTDINGLTGMFKPGKNFFSSALQRKGDLTTFDAIQGIDKYLEGASKLIHQTDNIKRLRGLEKTLRDGIPGNHLSNFVAELGEYTNILAGKKAMIDRAAEDVMGRTIYTIINNLKKRTGANMVGANVSSALTNYIPLTQAAATTDKRSFVKGMIDTISNIFKNDGFVDSSDFLTRRIGSDPLSIKSWQKAANWMFDAVDGFTAQVVVRSKYLEGIKKGLTHSQAIKQADDWAVRMMADRTAGALPTLFNSQSLGILTQFQTEVNNQLSFIFKDIPRNATSKAAAASAIGQVFLYGYIFNNLYERVVGRRPAFDPINIAMDAAKGYAEGEEGTTRGLIVDVAEQLPFSSILTGGRIPIGAYLPNVVGMIQGEVKPTSLKEWAKPLALLPPTGGGQIKKTLEGALSLKKGGNYSSYLSPDAKLRFPVERTPANIGRSLLFGQYSTPEAREYFDKNRRMLSEYQTKAFQYAKEYGIDPETMYEIIMEIRELEPLQNRKVVTDAQKTQVIAKSDLPQQHKALLNKLFVKTEIGKKIIEKKLK